MHNQIDMSSRHAAIPTKSVVLATAGAVVLQGLLLLPLQAQNKTDNKFNDKDVTSAVEEHFLFDSAVPSSFVDVKTNEGIVTLTGKADNVLAKERAAKIARSIKGVRAVLNNIDVQTQPRSDEEIRKDIESALIADAATDSYEIKPSVNGGIVTLSGTVQSFREKDLAAHVARGIRGVKDIKNDIAVKYKATRPDSEIVADVKRALETDVWVDAAQINANASQGKVTLTGKVGSAAEKSRAQGLAWVTGAEYVDVQGLNVDPTLARNTRNAGLHVLPDGEIAKAVKDAFLYDPRVLSFNPDVEVRRGVVTLTGVVDNLKAKQAAEQDARNTFGVYRVKNHLKVRPVNPPPNDMLAQNVKNALQRDVVVNASQITPAANNGTVTLNGSVDSNYEKSHAEDVVERLNGVVQVKNHLQVNNPSLTYENLWWDPYYAYNPYYRHSPTTVVRSDAEIKDDIEDQLFWSPFVDSNDINVAVDHGVATLSGMVDSWSEFRTASENAREGGATSVVNKLTVNQGS